MSRGALAGTGAGQGAPVAHKCLLLQSVLQRVMSPTLVRGQWYLSYKRKITKLKYYGICIFLFTSFSLRGLRFRVFSFFLKLRLEKKRNST